MTSPAIMPLPQRSTATPARSTVLAVGWMLIALCWFATMASRPLLEPDEGRYAEIPREMWVSGDWLVPHLDGLRYFEKPPLQYWATATAYELFGWSESSARLWSLSLAFACLVLAWIAARRWYGEEAAAAALVALAVNPVFAVVGQLNLLDAPFSAFCSAAIFAFVQAQQRGDGSRAERGWMLAAWGAAGLAVLSKGIAIVALSGLTLVLYSALTRDLAPWRRLHLVPGLALFAALTVPWFVLMARSEPDFLGFFFVHEHLARFLTKVHQRAEPWWFFPVIAAFALWPAAALPRLQRPPPQPAGGAAARPRAQPPATRRFATGPFLAAWCIVVVTFFSISGSKLAPYILPMMPAAAVLIGHRAAGGRRWWRRTAIGAALALLVALAALAALARHTGQALLPTATNEVAALLTCGIGLAVLAIGELRGDPPWGRPIAAASLAALSLLGWQCALLAYERLEPHETARALARQVRIEIDPATHVFSVGQYRQTLVPYLGRTLDLVDYRGELDLGLQRDPVHEFDEAGFLAHWRQESDAVAFIEPRSYARLAAAGLDGRIVADDGASIVVRRR